LSTVSDGTNTSDVEGAMRVLVGDTSANGAVNSSDVAQTQSQAGQSVTSANAREDVTANGAINSSDVALVQSLSGTSAASVSGAAPATGPVRIRPLPLPENETVGTRFLKWHKLLRDQ